jgi:PKD repeat protein
MPFNLGGDSRFVITWDQLKTPATLTFTFTPATTFQRFQQWGFGNGGGTSTNPAKATYYKAGKFTLSGKCYNGDGTYTTVTGQVSITATPPPPPPLDATFELLPTMAQTGTIVSVFRPGKHLGLTCTWDWGDSSVTTGCPTSDYRYPDPGVFTVTLTVRDRAGHKASSSHQVTITQAPPKPPKPWVRLWASQRVRRVGCPVIFNWEASEWVTGLDMYYGDTARELGNIYFSHAYQSSGLWEATIVATDPWGQRANAHTAVEVNDNPRREEDELYGTGPNALANPLCDPRVNCDPRHSSPGSSSIVGVVNEDTGQVPCWALDRAGKEFAGRCFRAIGEDTFAHFTVIQFHDDAVYTLVPVGPNGKQAGDVIANLRGALRPGWYWNRVVKNTPGVSVNEGVLNDAPVRTVYGKFSWEP